MDSPGREPRIAPDTGPPPASAVERLLALADQCVLCGLCLPHCPTYALDRIEAESPRGRIMQFRGIATGAIQATDAAQTHLDHCLACRNCEPVCPAGVRYGELLVEGRALLRRDAAPPWRQRLLEWLVARPRALAMAAATARATRRWLPGPQRRLAEALQAPRRWPDRTPAPGPSRGRVGLLTGCVARHVQPEAITAALRVLSALGWDVHVPAAQGCCGAIARHAGDPDQGRRHASRTAATFADVEHVLVLDSGCVESLRCGNGTVPITELLQFVADDARLDQLALRPHPGPLALQLPCTQRNVTFGAAAARALLRRLGTEPLLIGERGCCGAAGSQALLDPARAATFREPLLDAVAAGGAATLASGNVGCRMHLQAGLRDRPGTAAVRVVHPIELLAEHLP